MIFRYTNWQGTPREFAARDCPDVEAARHALQELLDTPVTTLTVA